ncbi:MAG: arsenate reductase family protein, partial [Frisingicoccus sp.]|nr:arsenate reductase family protein [Frisingicoccus sp.]
MSRLFVEYPKCSTCRKAKKYLEENQVDFIDRHIVEERPT